MNVGGQGDPHEVSYHRRYLDDDDVNDDILIMVMNTISEVLATKTTLHFGPSVFGHYFMPAIAFQHYQDHLTKLLLLLVLAYLL